MKSVRKSWRGVLAALVVCAVAASASAQVLKQVPSDSTFVFKVKHLQEASDKLRDISKKFGFAEANPALADPLGFLKQQLNVKQGLNEKGEMAVAVFVIGAGQPQVLGLVPVTDYKAFIGNFGEPQKEGDVDVLSTAGAQPLYAMNWGEYAAVTPAKELLSKQKGLEVATPAAKLMADRDISVFANIKALRPMVLPQLQMIKGFVGNMPAQPGADANQMAFQRAAAKQVFEVLEKFFQECDGALLAVNVSPNESLYATVALDYGANTAGGKFISGMKGSDADLLKGLPQDNYVAMFGWTQSGAGAAKLIEDFYFPILKAINLPEAEAQKLQQGLEAMKAEFAAMRGGAFGLLTPKPEEIAQNGALHGLALLHGDANQIFANARKLAAVQDVFQKISSAGMQVAVDYKQNAKTVDGVALDEQTIKYTVPADNPQGREVEQLLKGMFGEKMVTYTGVANDNTVLSGVNVSDQQLQSLVTAIKQGQTPAGEVNAAATSQLPKERLAVGYIYVGRIVHVVMAVSGRPAPEEVGKLPPIGVSLGAEASTLRVDLQVPANTVESLVTFFKTIAPQRRGPQPRGGQL